MAKVKYPLFSGDVRGAFGKKMIFRRGGVVTRIFSPRNPRSIAQQAQRELFKELYMGLLTQEQADLLYAAIAHLHDERYSLLSHLHDHGALQGLGDDDHSQYYNQTRGDARYALIANGVTNGNSHDHAGGDGANLKSVYMLGMHGLGASVAASTTLYLVPFINGITTMGGFPISGGGTVKNFRVRQNGTQPASGSLVCTVQKGLVDTALTVTAIAGSAAQVLVDNSHTVGFVDGDVFCVTLRNNATSSSAGITYVSVEVERAVYP